MKKEIFRIDRTDAVLVAIDYQEKLLPAMKYSQIIEKNTIKLAKGLAVLGIPKIVTTQYAKGLGQTTDSVAEALGEFEPIDKTFFSAYRDENFKKRLEESGKNTVILAGIETHICVEQTALDLLQAGYGVVLAADCCGSRDPQNHGISMVRLSEAGAVMSTGESILYEILGSAKAPEFKEISAIVK